MVYYSWDMACDRWTDVYNCYFSFWAIFCPFTPLTCLKNENFKKMKKIPGDIIILYKCIYQKSWSYAILFLWYGTWQMQLLYFILGYFLHHKESKFQKKWRKNAWRYHFTQAYQKLWLDDLRFPRSSPWRMDGQIEKVTHRGGCPS